MRVFNERSPLSKHLLEDLGNCLRGNGNICEFLSSLGDRFAQATDLGFQFGEVLQRLWLGGGDLPKQYGVEIDKRQDLLRECLCAIDERKQRLPIVVLVAQS